MWNCKDEGFLECQVQTPGILTRFKLYVLQLFFVFLSKKNTRTMAMQV